MYDDISNDVTIIMQPSTSIHEWMDEKITKRPILKGHVMFIGCIGTAEV